MGGGKVDGVPPYFKLILSLPLSRCEAAQSLLDARGIPFQVVMDPASPNAVYGRHICLLYPHGTEQRDEWLGILSRAGLEQYSTAEPYDYDPGLWVRRWKEYYEWIRVDDRLAIGPAFKECPFDCEKLLRIDPGQAFGTGGHESTRIATELMVRELEAGAPLLDVGCGTGVLAIAGALLGATPVTGVDVEQEACTETLRNAALNGVEVNAIRGSADCLTGVWPLVVANMLYLPQIERIEKCLNEKSLSKCYVSCIEYGISRLR